MTDRVAFDAPVEVPNGGGGVQTGWREEMQAFARIRYLRGGETVIAARLASRQPVVVTIRASQAALMIRPTWRMRDARAGTVYNIRTIVPSDDRQYLELTAESGVVP